MRQSEKRRAGKRCEQEWDIWCALGWGGWQVTSWICELADIPRDCAHKRLAAMAAGGWPIAKRRGGRDTLWRRLDVPTTFAAVEYKEKEPMTAREFCNKREWVIGTRLASVDPKAEHQRLEVVTISALGRDRVLVTWATTHHETDLPLNREWKEVRDG